MDLRHIYPASILPLISALAAVLRGNHFLITRNECNAEEKDLEVVLRPNSAVFHSHCDPVCDEETVSEGLSGQHEEQRGDSRAAGHV